MGKAGANTQLTPQALERYLRAYVHPEARLEALAPLGVETQAKLKAYGYGRPLRMTYRVGDARRELVLRTMSPDPFGHDRRCDRAAVLLGAFDTFSSIPRHIRATDVGAFDGAGELVPMAHGDVYLVTDYVEGELYAADLDAIAGCDRACALDIARAEALGRYLAELHRAPADASAYVRDLRDTVGGGEGIFGLCESYPADDPVAGPARLEALEHQAVRWRWRLRGRAQRARRTHGDFHPFNLLFRDGTDFSVLDCSRGGAGEPADDITCLTINYLFFGLVARGAFDGAMRRLWDAAWGTYLDASEDPDVLGVVAPFFAWRALVLASPVWYPDVPDATRDRLLRFVEALLEGAPFRPDRVGSLL